MTITTAIADNALPVLQARQIHLRHDRNTLLADVSLQVKPGALHAILGPNGAGKTSLLRVLAGELHPSAGSVEYAGRPLHQWNTAQLARVRAVLPQHSTLGFAFSAREVVALGRPVGSRRDPHSEHRIVAEVLAAVQAEALAERSYLELSGGERARIHFARVLAQIWDAPSDFPRCLLLDEPTAHLDIAHQHHCLRLSRRLAAQGMAIVAIVHDPNLVLRYADTVTLLDTGRVVAQGVPADILRDDCLSRVYRIGMRLVDCAGLPGIRVAD